jgi:phosphatidylinositol alpha-1,6-mannosyltransferase
LIKTEYLKKTRSFCLLHSKEINHEIGSSLNKRLIKSTNKADFIIANSNFTKKLAIKVGINPSKIHVIFPGIQKPKIVENISKIKAEKIFGSSFPKIITVARLDKRKGHDKILMLIKNLKPKFPKIKYVSVGTGEEESSLVKLSKELSLEKEVIFLKNIDSDLKIALIAEANLFLMPSRIEKRSVEGFGISFVEAASYGVASIGGKDGGASDAITHNKTGLICDGKDLSSIYDSVIDFFQNEKFIKYGRDAKKFSENFHWNIVIKNYLKLIN